MRVTRTFCFLDLCGFTSFTDEHGDQEAVAVLGHLRAVLRAEAENSGVRVTKWLGDGAMLSGVDATAVIACAATVRDVLQADGALALRGGICTGKVIMFEGDDYIGFAVNVAARLCAKASPGQLLLTAETVEHVPDAMTPVALGKQPMSGLKQPIDVLALDPVAVETAPVRPAV
ncbi:MAG TPA: adenylate/guanylate cyclase domain-containing protein [Baekduia sp.]|uniref:adenylate/guanylate cyclase domain-containing protein n=1 Tax=Baekduia sp. TaxID=2600305 RepID=UPI002D79F902|nr:adenylate/guanylate cyclase domain-containing protein [Baekduia sp.]HET6507329.1 adenylate/guanylate cyclase domain-containing protein [Baekduia sp.]